MLSRIDEDRALQSRRRIGAVMAQVLSRLVVAQHLLGPKARRSPASAEAESYRQLLDARRLIDQWVWEAGKIVGMEVENGKAETDTHRLDRGPSPIGSPPTSLGPGPDLPARQAPTEGREATKLFG